MRGRAAIAGLGITEMGRVYGRTSTEFAADAVKLALEDAGLEPTDLDGLLINSRGDGLSLNLQTALGLQNLKLLNHMNAAGSTDGAMVQFAVLAVVTGMASVVACVFADASLSPGKPAGAAYAQFGGEGLDALPGAYGIFGDTPHYAMAAQRHMALFGTRSEQLGAIAVAQRQWAVMNPRAQMRKPITIADHQASRWIVEPLHLLDCCLVSNGGVAVIVTSAERARSLKQPPVHVLGWGQGHPGDTEDKHVRTGAAISGPAAMRMAGITPADVDVCELYDCFTYAVLVTLEDYGLCAKGEGGPFVEDGKLGPGGSLPTNTGGGQLSSYYMWGMTPISEAVMQARGQAGERQVAKRDIILVSGNGGPLAHHSTLVLSPRG